MGGGGVVAAARCDVRSPALPGQEARMPSPQSEDLRQKVVDAVPRNRGTVITMVGALRMEGLVAMMTIQGGVCSDVFVSYVKQVLVPALQPGDIVVVDNLAAHKDPRVAELLDSVDASLLFLPPYSPDLNPIESLPTNREGGSGTGRPGHQGPGCLHGVLSAVTPSADSVEAQSS